jgi:uncharacterized membrane protein
VRTPKDRLRHMLGFELIGLALVTPLGAWAFHLPLHDVGLLSVAGATLAAAWTYLYNWLFDLGLQRWAGTTLKTLPVRIVHAALFELGLLLAFMPLIAVYLGISLWEALLMDGAFALFYLVYGFAYNWAYDRLFPLAEWQRDVPRESLSAAKHR